MSKPVVDFDWCECGIVGDAWIGNECFEVRLRPMSGQGRAFFAWAVAQDGHRIATGEARSHGGGLRAIQAACRRAAKGGGSE